MKNKMLIVIGGLLAALLVIGVVGATSVYAQEPVNTLQHGRGPGWHGSGLSDAELEAVAKVLGMTTDEVLSALQSGKTLLDLANEKGVAIEDVQAALQAVRVAEMRDAIAQAVEDGTMTQEKADWLLEGLDKGFIGGGDGLGWGRGWGMRGLGFGRGLNDCPMMQTPASSDQ
ncbi:MAG TPA: hypothetical protein VNK49_13500 [Anaerolineales bacterium]|nr:hypothetical protein [Anaerolineales bacterium]